MTVTRTPIIDSQRLWDDLMKIAEFTDQDVPYTRRAFTPLFMDGRNWLKEQFAAAGLTVRTDSAANLIGRIAGSNPESGTIMLGSHSDTVPGGGRFDGVAGVIAALEIGRALKQQGFNPRHNIEIVDFLAEEPNVYGLSCVGSRAIAGMLDEKMLGYSEPGGETLAQGLTHVGGDPKRIADAKRSDIRAFFELHIEQGPVLENESINIGLVTAIVGIWRIEIVFRGEADHSGTTPMNMRRDAGAALAETIVLVRRLAEQLALAGEGYFVATVGVVDVKPNAINVVPESGRLIIDARSVSRPLMERFYETLTEATESIAENYNVELDGPKKLSDTKPSICNENLKALLDQCARNFGLTTRELASGAGHDAAFISNVAPMAMVFVPCKLGKSHAAQEWAEAQDLANGANTIAEAIMRFDAR